MDREKSIKSLRKKLNSSKQPCLETTKQPRLYEVTKAKAQVKTTILLSPDYIKKRRRKMHLQEILLMRLCQQELYWENPTVLI